VVEDDEQVVCVVDFLWTLATVSVTSVALVIVNVSSPCHFIFMLVPLITQALVSDWSVTGTYWLR